MIPQKILSRDFILCSLAHFVFSSVFAILIPTIPIYLSRFEAKEAEIGFLIGIFSFSSLIFRPIVGRALLNIPERDLMIAGTLLYVFSSIAYLLAPPFWPLLVVRIFHGIGLAFFTTAIFTLVANITPAMHRGQLISYFFYPGVWPMFWRHTLGYSSSTDLTSLFFSRFARVYLYALCSSLQNWVRGRAVRWKISP